MFPYSLTILTTQSPLSCTSYGRRKELCHRNVLLKGSVSQKDWKQMDHGEIELTAERELECSAVLVKFCNCRLNHNVFFYGGHVLNNVCILNVFNHVSRNTVYILHYLASVYFGCLS